MRRALPAFVILGARLALGCGAAQSPEAPDEGLPLRFPPPAAATVSRPPVEEPEATPPAPGEATTPCPLRWAPRELHGSVLTLPAELHGRMVAPLIRAACACTRPGQSVMLAARIVPGLGEVTAKTADRPDQRARESRSIDACLARELGAARFEPFHIGSDSVLRSARGAARAARPGRAGPLSCAEARRVRARGRAAHDPLLSAPHRSARRAVKGVAGPVRPRGRGRRVVLTCEGGGACAPGEPNSRHEERALAPRLRPCRHRCVLLGHGSPCRRARERRGAPGGTPAATGASSASSSASGAGGDLPDPDMDLDAAAHPAPGAPGDGGGAGGAGSAGDAGNAAPACVSYTIGPPCCPGGATCCADPCLDAAPNRAARRPRAPLR